jgi:hypothetical protein
MKKKSHKRMMDGGMAGMDNKMARGPKMMGGRPKPMGRGDMVRTMPIEPPMKAMPGGRPAPRMSPEMMDRVGRAMAASRGGMRGGGLARKGVGMALAKGGLAKRAGGCAKRGVGRGKMV